MWQDEGVQGRGREGQRTGKEGYRNRMSGNKQGENRGVRHEIEEGKNSEKTNKKSSNDLICCYMLLPNRY